MEQGLIIAGAIIVIGSKSILKYIKRRSRKKKLRKRLYNAFDDLDYDAIKVAIRNLQDYDRKYRTQKLKKYLNNVCRTFRDDETQLNINETKLKEAVLDLGLLEHIFDITDEEQNEQDIIIEDSLDLTRIRLDEIKRKRKEVMMRKDAVRQIQRQKKRQSGAMG